MSIVILQQTLKLLLFLSCGFLLTRLRILPEQTPRCLSRLLLWLFSPALSLRSFAGFFTPEMLKTSSGLLMCGIICTALSVLFALVIGRRFHTDHYTQDLCIYSIAIPNYGYVGYVLVLSIFGEEMFLKYQIFALPCTFYIYTEGYRMLLGETKRSFRNLLTPPMAAVLLGALLGLLRVPMPALADSVLSDLSGCVGPCGMVLTGCVIAQFSFREILREKLLYAVTFLRMVGVPLLAYGLGRLLSLPRELLLLVMCFLAMPTGVNTVVFPSTIGKDCHLGAGMALVSNPLAVLTIPLLLSLPM